MFDLKHNVRPVIAALCGIAYMATLQQFSPLVALLMHGAHEMQVIEHDGHSDLLLHHDDDDAHEQHEQSHQGTHAEDHAGHKHHHDHVLCLTSTCHATTLDDQTQRVPLACACRHEWLETIAIAELQNKGGLVRARPPPLINSGALHCLRTTVLVV
jgi:ABC-type Zn2+ transport system substrate-binding protein/surface adhesin